MTPLEQAAVERVKEFTQKVARYKRDAKLSVRDLAFECEVSNNHMQTFLHSSASSDERLGQFRAITALKISMALGIKI